MTVTEVALATSIPPSLALGASPEGARRAVWAASCLASWPGGGWRVLSLNPEAELPLLPALPAGVVAAPAGPGVAEAYGRPGAWIAEALAGAVATGAEVVGLVNADIRLDLDPAARAAIAARAREGMLAFNRMELAHPAQQDGAFYRYGYDLVLMPRAMAARLDLAGFAFGVPWWDYWILLDALTQGLPASVVWCPGVRHLAHAQAWRMGAWRRGLALIAARLPGRRDALAALGAGPVALALADLLAALGGDAPEGIGLAEIIERAGTRFGLEIVRLAERDAWSLDGP
ncbi:hypothetical protein GXW77_18960 [Roseomonas alkaliterrae]|uniref:Glycosyltransferase n=1 Tax=Neoroseomonas alkaliterrae TaxID=1452450 RepID=A0A840XSC3_9PROT|nr:hypothetical protein [Neoroseomonas alkaliterrae]MBB5689569.1 hypothetical protein [Neoroseomonas alkaliterrae]MBR0678257.1 hypothetical protein [Neoroseomonas alkaliterrae]